MNILSGFNTQETNLQTIPRIYCAKQSVFTILPKIIFCPQVLTDIPINCFWYFYLSSQNGNSKKIYYFVQFTEIIQKIVYLFFLKYIFVFLFSASFINVLSINHYAHCWEIDVPEISKKYQESGKLIYGTHGS